MRWRFALAIAITALAACGPPDPPPKPEDTVFGDQVEALEKARAVEDEALQRKQELDERLKKADDGG